MVVQWARLAQYNLSALVSCPRPFPVAHSERTKVEEDMGQNGTEERYSLYREDAHGREGQAERTARRDYGKISEAWQILRTCDGGAGNAGGGKIIWYLELLQGLVRGCRHFREGNTVKKLKILTLT